MPARICASWICASALALGACLEPNPNATDAGETAGTTDPTTDPTTTNADTGTSGGPLCDPCELAFETLAWDAGKDGFSGSVPKPDQPNTAPIAFVQDYRPGNAENLGYAITWTDAGDSWDIQVEVFGAANNSHVRGLAVVVGAAEAPDIDELTITAADMCGAPSVSGDVVVASVERYEPGADAVLSYAATGGEYCITTSTTPEASIHVRAVGFAVPGEGVSTIDIPDVVLDSGAPVSLAYDQIPAGAEVVHLIGAREYDDSAADDLGYTIDCSASSPYACDYDLSGFQGGARVVAAGTIVGIQ